MLDQEFQRLAEQIGYMQDTAEFNDNPLFVGNRRLIIPMDDLGDTIEFSFSSINEFQSNQSPPRSNEQYENFNNTGCKSSHCQNRHDHAKYFIAPYGYRFDDKPLTI